MIEAVFIIFGYKFGGIVRVPLLSAMKVLDRMQCPPSSWPPDKMHLRTSIALNYFDYTDFLSRATPPEHVPLQSLRLLPAGATGAANSGVKSQGEKRT